MTKQRFAMIAAGLVAGIAVVAGFGPHLSTIRDLQSAFASEESAHYAYLSYAKEAEKEGYFGAASLFRAVAAGEQVHASRHGALVNAMGDIPSAPLQSPEARSLRDNLAAAIAAEKHDHDVLYPKLIVLASSRGEKAAVEALTLARAAEAGHAQLFADALAHPEALMKPQTFHVCSGCGYVTRGAGGRCPVCGCVGCAVEVK